MRTARGIEQHLRAKAFGKARGSISAALASIEETAHQPRNRGDAFVGRSVADRLLDRNRL